jgi:membrane protein
MDTHIIPTLKKFVLQLKAAFSLFQENDPLRLAGATAFFTNFALPPILIILIRLFGFFIDRKTFVARLFERLSTILDASSITQIRQTLVNIRKVDQNGTATFASFIFFLFVATTLFTVIKSSMDQIWKIGIKPHASFMFGLKLRARSMVIILLAGLLFLIGVLTDSIQAFVASYLNSTPNLGRVLLAILNQVLFISIVMVWFSVLFRFLTNGRPSWGSSFVGGLLTSILFTMGKYILRIMLPLSNIGSIYGTSGSIVLIMLFVFYSSFIFYFGACFVKVLSDEKGVAIRPINGAFSYELTEVIKDDEV